MKQKKLFDEVKTPSDIKKVISTHIEKLIKRPNQNTEQYILSLNNLVSNNDERIVSYAHTVDKDYKTNNRRSDNARAKIPVFLTGIIFLDKCSEEVKQINNSELAILSDFSKYFDSNEFKKITKLYNKDILKSVDKKISEYSQGTYLLREIESKYDEFDINVDSPNLEDFQKQLVTYIDNMTSEDVRNIVDEKDNNMEFITAEVTKETGMSF